MEELIISKVDPCSFVDTGQMIPHIKLRKRREMASKAAEARIAGRSVTTPNLLICVFNSEFKASRVAH